MRNFVRAKAPCANAVSLQYSRDPANQACSDFVTVELIEHFVPSTAVEVVRDVVNARLSIAGRQDLDAYELLADGIFASRKQVDGQVAPDLAKTDRIRQSGRSREKRRERRGLELRKAQRVMDECIDHCAIAAQPIERRTRWFKTRVQDVLARWT